MSTRTTLQWGALRALLSAHEMLEELKSPLIEVVADIINILSDQMEDEGSIVI